jgi:hypothetical protein
MFMRKLVFTAMLATLALGLNTSVFGADKPARQELDEHTHAINQLAEKGDRTKLALHDISVETGVPMEQIQSMHEHHPDAGPAGIMNACVLADNTKKSPEQFLEKHINGKSWVAIAKDNNVSLDKLNERLDRLERTLATDKEIDKREKKHKD